MKLVLIAFAAVALSLGAAFPRHGGVSTYGLKEDFDDFLALIPKNEILNILVDYLGNDAEVQQAAEYIQSDDFKGIVLEIEAIPEYRDVSFYLFILLIVQSMYKILCLSKLSIKTICLCF